MYKDESNPDVCQRHERFVETANLGSIVPRIVLLGDFAPVEGVASAQFEVDVEDTDLVLMNLETPLPRHLEPRPKAGPALSGSFDVLARFVTQDFVLTLANNHMMDYGKVGLRETIDACRNAGFETSGAGANLDAALQPVSRTIRGVKIGILACTETQFGIATPQRAGVAPLGFTIYAAIRKLKSEVDIVIVSIHGAAEMCPWPSPQWQDLLRSFIDAGASIIHGHHSHVPQGYEEYHGGLIFYGLGNFLVEPARWRDTPNALWSIVGDVTLSAKGVKKLLVKTAVIEDSECVVVREGNDSEAALHRAYLSHANYPLADRKLLTGLWQESSIRMYHLWNAKWLGFKSETVRIGVKDKLRSFMRGVHKSLFGRPRRQGVSASQDNLLLWYVLFACESHRDSIATALGVLSGELEDMRTDETRALADEMMPWSVDGGGW